jgi:hypothetical protein
MDTLYTCVVCGQTQVREEGKLYPANVPTHCELIMRATQLPSRMKHQLITTNDHTIVLSPGGLMILPTDELDGIVEEDEPVTPDHLARCEETVHLSYQELEQLVTLFEQHRTAYAAQAREVDVYLQQVAQALLDVFAETAKGLCERQQYWWPEIRRQAAYECIVQANEKSHPIISAWRDHARRNRDFPLDQQEVLLMRHFQRLYYERYPEPKHGNTNQDVTEEG